MKTISIRTLTLLFALPTMCLHAQTLTILHSFTNGADGLGPSGSLVLSGGTLYGVSVAGTNHAGLVYSVDTNGSNFTSLHTFSSYTSNIFSTYYANSDGAEPQARLLLSGATLFGTAFDGGTNGSGTVFSVGTNSSNFALIHTFSPMQIQMGSFPITRYLTNADGALIQGGLVESGGVLYGAAAYGGLDGGGTLFAVSTNGSGFNVIYTFPMGQQAPPGIVSVVKNAFGSNPEADLAISNNIIYGTTLCGGTNGVGTIYSFDTINSTYTVLHTFASGQGVTTQYTNMEGAFPARGLVLSGNALFGLAPSGGTNGDGTVFSMNIDGSGFRVLHTFNPNVDGWVINGDLTLAGATLYGAAAGSGSFFSMDTNGGNFRLLYEDLRGDGFDPSGGLPFAGNLLYGVAPNGPSNSYGSLFSFTIPSVISSISRNPDASVTLNIAGAPNYSYFVQSTTNLSPAFWQTISTNTAAADGTWQFTDSNAALIPAQFYRTAAP